jgi:anti-anti-sigma factor
METVNRLDTEVVSSIDVTPNTVLVYLKGELDLFSAPPAQQAIELACSENPGRSITVNLTKVDFIDSAGLALLVFFHKARKTADKLCIIVASRSQPERVLKLGKFDLVLNVISEG